LVDRLVRDPHALIVGEVQPQAAGDLLRAPALRAPELFLYVGAQLLAGGKFAGFGAR
jgi:hypothetical protein